MSTSLKKHHISIFLAKDHVSSYSDLIKPDPNWKIEEVILEDNSIAWVTFKVVKKKSPKWTNFFSTITSVDKFGKNASTGALLIMEHHDRFFVLPFGTGYHQIRLENIETDFGLKTSLNCIDDECIRCVDKSSLEAQPKDSREQAGNQAKLHFFGIDIERDLLKAVTGKPALSYKKLGSRITGRDQVKFAAEVTPNSVTPYFDMLLEAYQSENYKKGSFAWVDHIGLIKDKTRIEELNESLIQKLLANELEKLWLSVPEIINWDTTYGFKYFRQRSPSQHDVNASELLELLNSEEQTITIDLLKRKKILSVDANGEIIHSWPVIRFIYTEIETPTGHYLLNNEKWYKIDNDYAKSIDSYFDSIPRYPITLPSYADNSETAYNARVANSDHNICLLDRKNIKISTTASPVEPCDLLYCPDTLIHIKRYGGSSVLSHLFNQGLVSGELLKREPEFKKELIKKLGDDVDKTNLKTKNPPLKIVYGIISEYDHPLSLPFFSKVSLKHAVSRLKALEYQVEIAQISVAEAHQKLKKYPSKTKRKKL